MNRTMRAMVVALAVISIAGWAVAQSTQPQTYPSDQQRQQMAPSGQSMSGTSPSGQMGQSSMGMMGQQYYAEFHSANDVLGKQVKNNQGESLGTLEEIVLEPGLNYIAYGVLSKGGFLGMGENYFAIPWDTFQLSSDRDSLILNIPAQAFEQAQGFDKNRWPDRADQRWRMQATGQQPMTQPMTQQPGIQQPMTQQPGSEQWRDQQWREQQQWRQQQQDQPQAMNQQQSRQSDEIYGRPQPQTDQSWSTPSDQQRVETYGSAEGKSETRGVGHARTAQTGAEGFQARRVTQLQNMDVQTYSDQLKIGNLNDVVIDFQQGLVAYGVVSLDGGNKAAVPWSAIEIRPVDHIALVDADRQTLEQVAFSGDQLPNLNDPQYARNIHEQFNRSPYWEVLGFVGGSAQARQSGAQQQSMQQQRQMQPQSMQQQSMQQQDATQYFNPQNIQVISGTVEGVGNFQPQQEGLTGQRLRVRTQDGQTIIVHSGPAQFIQQQGLTLQRGEQVQVRGSYGNVNGRSIFIASDIRTQNAQVQLRDQQGKPMWSSADMQQSQQQQW